MGDLLGSPRVAPLFLFSFDFSGIFGRGSARGGVMRGDLLVLQFCSGLFRLFGSYLEAKGNGGT